MIAVGTICAAILPSCATIGPRLGLEMRGAALRVVAPPRKALARLIAARPCARKSFARMALSKQVIAQALFRLRAFAKDLELGFAEIVDPAARIAVRQMRAHVGCDRLRIVMRDFTHIGGLQILSILTDELER
jgi:hypothetical protein